MNILKLQLVTPDLPLQHEFYTRVFDFPVLNSTSNKVEFKVGGAQLTFLRSAHPLAGNYHFAFNIPENQFAEAISWLRQRVALIPDKTGRDTFYSEDWDAHMAYFYDPAGNILELIARHTLPSASQHPFNGQSLLGLSEIGISAEDVSAQASAIVLRGQTAIYHTASSGFTAIGDEHGLFIVVKRGRIWFPETGRSAEALPLHVVTQAGSTSISWQFS